MRILKDQYQTADLAIREIALVVNDIMRGRGNNNGTVTLTPNTTTTTVADRRVAAGSAITLMPMTANAAAENWYIGTINNNSFVITHANAATADRTFRYIVRGE